MAKRDTRTKTTITLREEDWILLGNFTPETRPTHTRDFGHQPGDPSVVEDLELSPDGHHGVLSADDLTEDERVRCEDAIAEAAEQDYAADRYEAAERAGEAARDFARMGC